MNNGKYLIHIDYLYSAHHDISRTCCIIIERYIELLTEKDHALLSVLRNLADTADYDGKRRKINSLLTEDAEARIFEIISYAILKNHYKNIRVYFGYSPDDVKAEELQLFRTGRANANDGGIDFVMRPVGRFFQVTEVGQYDKYLLDIEKVIHFPITFVIKTNLSGEYVRKGWNDYIRQRSGGMRVIEERYQAAVEEIITINELRQWTCDLGDADIDGILRDIDIYYRIEMNLNAGDEE